MILKILQLAVTRFCGKDRPSLTASIDRWQLVGWLIDSLIHWLIIALVKELGDCVVALLGESIAGELLDTINVTTFFCNHTKRHSPNSGSGGIILNCEAQSTLPSVGVAMNKVVTASNSSVVKRERNLIQRSQWFLHILATKTRDLDIDCAFSVLYFDVSEFFHAGPIFRLIGTSVCSTNWLPRTTSWLWSTRLWLWWIRITQWTISCGVDILARLILVRLLFRDRSRRWLRSSWWAFERTTRGHHVSPHCVQTIILERLHEFTADTVFLGWSILVWLEESLPYWWISTRILVVRTTPAAPLLRNLVV